MINSDWLDDVLDGLVPIVPNYPQSSKQNRGQSKMAEVLMDKGSRYFVPDVPNVPTNNDWFVKKSADILERSREERRKKVLGMLADKPAVLRTFITDIDTDPANVILTIAIRDQYIFEMTIPKHKYEPLTLLKLINKRSLQ